MVTAPPAQPLTINLAAPADADVQRVLNADALTADQRIALYVIGQLAITHQFTRTQLFASPGALHALTSTIAAALCEGLAMLEPGDLDSLDL